MDSLARDLRYDPAIVLAHVRPFRIGDVEVRPATREVVAAAGREVLEPRVMQVLVALARAEGEFLTRDDLIASCWDGRVVGEDAITRVISRLRRLTEGLGAGSWTLETVTKVGYRLLPAHGQKPAATPSVRRLDRRALLAGGGALAAIGGAGAWWGLRERGPSREVLELVRQAEQAMGMGQPDQSAQAIGFLKQAVTLAPEYAPAWATLAQAYRSNISFTAPDRQAGVVALAEAAARRALELDPDNFNAAVTLAFSERGYRNWLNAERRITWAMGLKGGRRRLQMSYANFLLSVGRIREAAPFAQAGAERDKLAPWGRISLTQILLAAGRLEEAEREIREALALWPRHHAVWFNLFYLLTFSGRANQALAMAADPAALPPNIPAADMELSLQGARGVQGASRAEIDKAIRGFREAARRGVGYAENAVVFLSTLGDLDGAFEVAGAMYLNQGYVMPERRWSVDQGRYNKAGERNTQLLFMPGAARFRADPRFTTLVRDIGLTDYWKRSGHPPDDRRWMT